MSTLPEYATKKLSSLERIRRSGKRLKRVFWEACCIVFLQVGVIFYFLRWWDALPPAFRCGMPALLFWVLLATAYVFFAQSRVSQQLMERLRQRTYMDEVTGVFNYRYLELRMAEEAERIRRHGGLLALLYLDIDGLRAINDKYGRRVGDFALEQLATALARQVRTCDVLGRVGGDEFLAVLPEAGRPEANVLAERLRETAENYLINLGGDQVIKGVTVSIGVAAYPINGQTMDNVISAGVKAVDAAKEQGGNCVIMADEFIAADPVEQHIINTIRGDQP